MVQCGICLSRLSIYEHMFDAETTQLKHLAAAIDEVQNEDLARIFDDQAETGVVVMRRLFTELEAEWLRRLGDVEDRATFEAQGYTSLGSWLADRCRMWRLDADLDPESGQIIATALRALVEPQGRNGDERSSEQRRVDARSPPTGS